VIVSNKESEFIGNIVSVRALEDCIRATKKYTEGIGTMRKQHPIQGEGFPSRVFCKYYEVYPDIEVSWDMPAGVALDWLWGETLHIDVMFKYDYRVNKASVTVKDGVVAVRELQRSIPNFGKSLVAIVNGS
jgi:hypothetical protein